ncbi:hypothetical protein ACHAWF_013785 [Thalassiosira exigua]
MGSCDDAYNDERERFEAILYCSMLAWLFIALAFIPRNEAQDRQQQRRACGCLMPCCRFLTFCFKPCRPLLDTGEDQVTEAAKAVGTCGSNVYIMFFLLLKAVPPLALVVGVAFFFPHCSCDDGELCKCNFRIDFIPVGSCPGAALFFAMIVSLGCLLFANRAVNALRVIRNSAPYAAVSGDVFEQEVGEQEVV